MVNKLIMALLEGDVGSRNMDKNMDNNYIDKISNKEVIRQLIIFAMKHRRIMQKFLDETGVYQAQHRLLMEIFRNPDASQNDIARSMDVSAATIAVSLKKLEKGDISKERRLKRITGSIKLPLRRKETKLWSKASKFLIWYIKRSLRV